MCGAVLIRTDASRRHGLGHLQRCLALADGLHDLGVRCSFVVAGDPDAADRPRRLGFDVVLLRARTGGSTDDAAETLAEAGDRGCGTVVVDSYDADVDYLNALRRSGRYVAVIDDRAAFPFPSQLVVNSGVHAALLPCVSARGDTTFLLGPSYALLRRSFRGLSRRRARRRVRHVLLTLGGSDPQELTAALAARLGEVDGGIRATVIVGPLFRNGDAIAARAGVSRTPVHVVTDPPDIQTLMRDADLAISGGGQSLYELAATGTPTIAIVVAENQRPQVDAFEASGFLWSAGSATDADVLGRTLALVEALIPDVTRRRASSRAGQGLVDGFGACRVAAAIVSPSSGEGTGMPTPGASARDERRE